MYSKNFLEKTGITKDTLRYYNEVGLLCPKVNPHNNYKIYSEADVEKINLTKTLQLIGFTIKEIIDIHSKLEDTKCKHIETLPFLEEQNKKIEYKITELKKLNKRISNTISEFQSRNCEVKKTDFSLH